MRLRISASLRGYKPGWLHGDLAVLCLVIAGKLIGDGISGPAGQESRNPTEEL
jgi:hypothetical protein